MKRSLGLILALVTTAGAAAAGADDSVRQIAETTAAQWNAAFSRGQVDEILNLYAANALLVQPNGAVARGAGEIRAFWQTLIRQGDYAMVIVDVRGEQDGSIVATARLSDNKTLESPKQQVVKYNYGGVVYNVLKRQADGSWKAQVQRWNSDRNI